MSLAYTLVDRTPALALVDAGGPADRHPAVRRFLGEVRRLPTFARTHQVHRASGRAALTAELERVLRALDGKLVVQNPGHAACFPPAVAALARGLVRAAAQPWAAEADAVRGEPNAGPGRGVLSGVESRERADLRRARAFLGAIPSARALLADEGWGWCALVLCEVASIAIGCQVPSRTDTVSPEVEFVAEVSYRLALVVGRGSADEAERALAADPRGMLASVGEAVAVPPLVPNSDVAAWFDTDVLLPDDEALRHMDAAAAAEYRRVTGRAGEGSTDRYWYLPTWERFGERGRVAGHVTPAFLASGVGRAGVGGGTRDAGGPFALTAGYDRGCLVPPGYCVVACGGTLGVGVALARSA